MNPLRYVMIAERRDDHYVAFQIRWDIGGEVIQMTQRFRAETPVGDVQQLLMLHARTMVADKIVEGEPHEQSTDTGT